MNLTFFLSAVPIQAANQEILIELKQTSCFGMLQFCLRYQPYVKLLVYSFHVSKLQSAKLKTFAVNCQTQTLTTISCCNIQTASCYSNKAMFFSVLLSDNVEKVIEIVFACFLLSRTKLQQVGGYNCQLKGVIFGMKFLRYRM